MKEEICKQLVEKKREIFSLSNSCGKPEDYIAKELYGALSPWDFKNLEYPGLFGWGKFKSDKFVNINSGRAIIEVKKIMEKSEYGYWHSLIQSLIYRFQENEKHSTDNFLFLCFILDWGRKSGDLLNENEKKFLSEYISQQIYTVRISMSSQPFIEHNLVSGWRVIC